MDKNDTGLLLNPNNIKIYRGYFKEMAKLLGIRVLFRSPIDSSKTYDLHGELDTFYNAPEPIFVIYDEYPKQQTMKKLGWNHEVDDKLSIIHVPYDLKGLQEGSLFIIPSGLDGAEGRVFKVIKMSSIAIYPYSIACEIGPMLYSDTPKDISKNYSDNTYTLLKDNKEDD